MEEELMEERLMAEYIGNDAEIFMKKNINWTAAFLSLIIGPVWFFYRKAYLIGFAFIIVTLILVLIASTPNNIMKVYNIMFFIYLVSANKLYLWDVRRKIKKILKKQEDMSEEQLFQIIRKKGGVNGRAATMYVFTVIALIMAFYGLFFLLIFAILGLI